MMIIWQIRKVLISYRLTVDIMKDSTLYISEYESWPNLRNYPA